MARVFNDYSSLCPLENPFFAKVRERRDCHRPLACERQLLHEAAEHSHDEGSTFEASETETWFDPVTNRVCEVDRFL